MSKHTIRLFTLVFLRKDNQILLGFKKRGFGQNKWNGFGGKVEKGETIIQAAARELKEESGITVKPEALRNIGHLEFTFEDSPVLMEVRVFAASSFEGVLVETEEMIPKWFDLANIPFNNMWLDDKIWFPYLLKNSCFYGHFLYRGFDEIIKYNVKELESMEKFYKESD